MKQKVKTALSFLALSSAFVYLIVFPQQTAASIQDSITLCLSAIIPSMFPYFILTNLFISSGCSDMLAKKLGRIMPALFGVSGQGAAPLLLGLLGGYPTGAKTISDLYENKKISQQDAKALTGFCCNAGPAFIIGAVGSGLYRSVTTGLALYGIHVLSALLCGLLNHRTIPKAAAYPSQMEPEKTLKFADALVSATLAAAKTMLKVCAFIVTFSCLISVLKLLFVTKNTLYYTLIGLLELSSGCAELASSGITWPVKFTLTSAFLSLGGLCVLFQTKSVFSGNPEIIRAYLTGKVRQSILSIILSYPVSFLMKPEIPAAAFPIAVHPISPFPYNFLPLLLLLAILLQFSSRNPSQCRL